MRTYNILKQLTLLQFRTMFRNKMAVFFSLMLPLIFLAVFGAMYGPDTASRTAIGWIDHDGGAVAQGLRQAVNMADLYNVTTGDEATLRPKLARGELRAIVLLPGGLSSQVAARQGPARVTVEFDSSSQSSGQALGGLQQLIGTADMAMQGAVPSLMVQAQDLPALTHLNVFDYLVPGELANMLLCAGLVTVAMSLSGQRQSGVLRHMFSTPLPIGAWMAARVLANLLMALLQIGILYGAAAVMFRVHAPANLPGTALLLVLGTLVTLGMGLAVGSIARNPDAANPIAMILYMASLFLGNAMMPLDGAPGIVQTLAHFTPIYYLTDALRQVMMQGKGVGSVVPDVAILVVFAAACFGLATWRIRKQFVTA